MLFAFVSWKIEDAFVLLHLVFLVRLVLPLGFVVIILLIRSFLAVFLLLILFFFNSSTFCFSLLFLRRRSSRRPSIVCHELDLAFQLPPYSMARS